MIKKLLLLFFCLNVFTSEPGFGYSFVGENNANSYLPSFDNVNNDNANNKVTGSRFLKESSMDDDTDIYIHPFVAERVIESFFGHIFKDNAFPLRSEVVIRDLRGRENVRLMLNDSIILQIVQGKWNACATKAPVALVSSDCIIDICDTVFKFVPKESWTEEMQKSATAYCNRFAAALMVSTENMPNKNCQYKVTKENGNQNRIKFERPDGSGYMNKTYYKNGKQIGTLAWRLNNPGNLRDAPARLACAVLEIKQPKADKNGVLIRDEEGNLVYGSYPFAVFDEPETGWLALKRLLSTEKYTGKTILSAMQTYAPSSDNNRPDVYAKHVKQALVERGQHAGDVGYYETVLIGQMSSADINVMMEAIKAEERTSEGEVIEF